MTPIATSQHVDSQHAPKNASFGPNDPGLTDIFNSLLGSIAPTPPIDQAGGIGRKGAPTQQKTRQTDPLASMNPTDTAVAQLATRGPVKATVAAAERESVSPASETVSRDSRSKQHSTSTIGRHQPDTAAPQQPRHADVPAKPVAEPVASQPNAPSQPVAASPPASDYPRVTAAARSAGPVSSNTALNRLIQSTSPRAAQQGSSAPRAILRPVVAHHAQGRATHRAAPQSQSPAPAQNREAEFADQLSRGFSAILRQNGGSLTLKLQPQDLGEMTIRMDLNPGRVAAVFEVESDQARQLLDQNMSTLRSALEARGLGVGSLTIQVNDRAAQDAPDRAEPQQLGGAGPDGGASGDRGRTGTERPPDHAFVSRSDESVPDEGSSGEDTGGAQVVRLALDAVA